MVEAQYTKKQFSMVNVRNREHGVASECDIKTFQMCMKMKLGSLGGGKGF